MSDNQKKLPYEQRLNTEQYKIARMKALVRDSFTCKYPGCRVGRLHLLTIHHLIPREEGGTHDLDNLITLCEAHHIEIHAKEGGPKAFREMIKQGQKRKLKDSEVTQAYPGIDLYLYW